MLRVDDSISAKRRKIRRAVGWTVGLLSALPLASSCAPSLNDTPFACGSDGSCPDGYHCEATVCLRDGAKMESKRVMRSFWINAGEMFWLPTTGGGATLVVNDGFTPGEHGLYEIVVAPDGTVGHPRKLLAYGDEFPMSSSVAALDATHYAVATLQYPNVDDTQITLTLRSIERQKPDGVAPAVETLFVEKQPYIGGSEPSYISALVEDPTIDIVWPKPSGAGVVMVHFERTGTAWKAIRRREFALPEDVLPLSADCLLWSDGAKGRVIRVGYESFATLAVDAEGEAQGEFVATDDIPLWAWKNELVSIRAGDEDPQTKAYKVSYVLTDREGTDIKEEQAGYMQEALEPYSAVPYRDGVLVAPISSDPAFPTLDVAFRSPTVGVTKVASIRRTSSDPLYSARALGHEGKVYLAWTSFHGAQMDLWVATAPLTEPPL